MANNNYIQATDQISSIALQRKGNNDLRELSSTDQNIVRISRIAFALRPDRSSLLNEKKELSQDSVKRMEKRQRILSRLKEQEIFPKQIESYQPVLQQRFREKYEQYTRVLTKIEEAREGLRSMDFDRKQIEGSLATLRQEYAIAIKSKNQPHMEACYVKIFVHQEWLDKHRPSVWDTVSEKVGAGFDFIAEQASQRPSETSRPSNPEPELHTPEKPIEIEEKVEITPIEDPEVLLLQLTTEKLATLLDDENSTLEELQQARKDVLELNPYSSLARELTQKEKEVEIEKELSLPVEEKVQEASIPLEEIALESPGKPAKHSYIQFFEFLFSFTLWVLSFSTIGKYILLPTKIKTD